MILHQTNTTLNSISFSLLLNQGQLEGEKGELACSFFWWEWGWLAGRDGEK